MNRTIALLLLGVSLLGGCKETKPDAASFVHGSTNVTIRNVKYFLANSGNTSSAESETYFIICELTFTNTLGYDAAPEPKNFVLTDPIGRSYVGVDSGASALVGISNYAGIVKKDAKQDYAIAFRVPANTSGTIFYAPF